MHIKKHFVYHLCVCQVVSILLLLLLLLALNPNVLLVAKHNTKCLLLLCIYLLFIECNVHCQNIGKPYQTAATAMTNQIKEYRMAFSTQT